MMDSEEQRAFDQRFEAVFKIGCGVSFLGFLGLLASGFAHSFQAAGVAFIVFITGAAIVIGNFHYDIQRNPRWKR